MMQSFSSEQEKFALTSQQIHYGETGNQSLPKEAAACTPAVPTAFSLLLPPTDKLYTSGFAVPSKDSSSSPWKII